MNGSKPVELARGERIEPTMVNVHAQGSKSFETVFRTHWPSLLNSLTRLLGDRAEAEDLALETFLRLSEKPNYLDSGREIRPWLFRVAMNLGYNALRARRRRMKYETTAGRQALVPHDESDPERLMIHADERGQVRQILGEMRSRAAILLFLRHSGFSYRELAEVVGVSPASIGSLLYRAERDFEKRYRKTYMQDEI